jgi:hypothetical protein
MDFNKCRLKDGPSSGLLLRDFSDVEGKLLGLYRLSHKSPKRSCFWVTHFHFRRCPLLIATAKFCRRHRVTKLHQGLQENSYLQHLGGNDELTHVSRKFGFLYAE